MRRDVARRYALLASGATWLSIVIWFVLANVIVRETRLAVVARVLDSLPPRIAPLAFTLFWLAFLLGWCIPLIIGLRGLWRDARD